MYTDYRLYIYGNIKILKYYVSNINLEIFVGVNIISIHNYVLYIFNMYFIIKRMKRIPPG